MSLHYLFHKSIHGLTYLWYRVFFKFSSLGTSIVFGSHITLSQSEHIGIGSESNIGDYCELLCHANSSAGEVITIGKHTWVGKFSTITASTRISIGSNVLISPNVHISDHRHSYEQDVAIMDQPLSPAKKVIIEDGCWIGRNVVVCPGTHLGKNSVVGANSVVSGIIPPRSVYSGNPAKCIKYFDSKQKKWVRP